MDKLNDLSTDLNEDVDIKNYENYKIKISTAKEGVIVDLLDGINEDVDVKEKASIKISKNKTPNFDSIQSKSIKDIDLVTPKKDFNFFKKNIGDFFKKQKKKIELIDKTTPQKTSTIDDIESNKINLPNINTKQNLYRIGLFLILLIFLGLSTKIIIEKCITNGYENILALKNDFKDLNKATQNIKNAKRNFTIAKILITPISFIPNENIRNVDYLVTGGNDMSKLLLKAIDLYEETSFYFTDNGGLKNINFTEFLEEIRENYEEIYSMLYNSLVNFNKIGDLGDDNLNSKLQFVNEKLMLGLRLMEVVNNNYDTLLNILGHSGERKYLVLFQNNDEIRPTGGFMGSTATLTISNGKIKEIENSDIYALEWAINKVYTKKDPAPEGLNKITSSFGIRDANYYPEFKDSSAKIKYFLDMIDYPIDGIIYINQNIILDLLEKIDGVDSKVLEQKITKDNFSLILSTLVEAKVFKVGTLGTPKQILFDFASELYEKLIHEKKYYDYANILLKHLQNRDIVFYSYNSVENSLLWKLGINGEVNFHEKLDFNYPVYTSIGGNKTDRYMEYRYDKTVKKLDESCDFVTSLEIYNSQLFSKFEDEKVNNLLDSYGITNKNDILNIQGRGDNKSFVRIILPKYAEVEQKKNQTIIELPNYKIVELYITTQKLETSKNIIEYTIKNPNCRDYSYKFFKEPGIKKYNINFNVFNEVDKYTNIETDFIYKRDEK